MKPIAQVLQEHTDRLMNLPGVVGTGESLQRGRPCVLVMVAALPPELRRSIPKEIEGYPVMIQETGELRAR